MKLYYTILILFGALASQPAQAQHDSLQSLVSHFKSYRDHHVQEKVFVHTDRSFYITGETIWFKAYCVDAAFNKPLDLSKVVYLELLDKENKSVLQTKVEMKDATGPGSLYLPSTLLSGNYLLRAYTQWMRNGSPEAYFQESITLVNPFVSPGFKKRDDKADYDIQFFPEGGHLVEGVQSKVAFRVVDHSGTGIEFKGAIIDGSDTVAHFHPLHFGLGSFIFRPLAGHPYKAVITDSKRRKVTAVFPVAKPEGFVMHVGDTSNNRLYVSIESKINQAPPIPYVYLLVHSRQVVVTAQTHVLAQNKTVFFIDKKQLREGASHITVFNEDLAPVAERLWYEQPAPQLTIDGHAGQNQYGIREKITIDLSTQIAGTSRSADLSVAVVKTDSANLSRSAGIYTYFMLTSELKGIIESPQFYLDGTATQEALDNLMLVHGWSRFSWDRVLHSREKQPSFLPEYHGHQVTGKILLTDTQQPAIGVSTLLSTPGKNIRLYLSKSDSSAGLRYEMRDFFGPKKLIVQSRSLTNDSYTIQLSSPFSNANSTYSYPEFDLSENARNAISKRSLDMQVQNIFQEDKVRFIDPGADSTAFYGVPDERYRLDDYTRFPTMEEVMREYVPGIMVRKRKDEFHFVTIEKGTTNVFRDNPLVLLDGIPVERVDKIMAYDPRKVQRLDVMTQRYYVGHLAFDGITSYRTYDGDLPGFEINPAALIANYEGLQLEREFYSPRYETKVQHESRLPDTRDLLFWIPSIKTDDSGKCQFEFYSSDVPGKYSVMINGLTLQGKAGSGTFQFEVKGKGNY